MQKEEIIKQINDVFIDILDDENVILKDETQAFDIEGWDSLTHIQLVVAVEKHFKVRFTSKEIQNWRNIGELAASIKSKI